MSFVGLGIYDFGLSKSRGRNEIADRHSLLLSGLYDFRGFLLGVIREDGFPHRVMQSTTREARAFTHAKDVSKNAADKNGLYPPRQPRREVLPQRRKTAALRWWSRCGVYLAGWYWQVDCNFERTIAGCGRLGFESIPLRQSLNFVDFILSGYHTGYWNSQLVSKGIYEQHSPSHQKDSDG